MRSVLVTGGAGFIGSNFVRYLLCADDAVEITNLDLLTYAGTLENLTDLPAPERHRFVHGDIGDAALVQQLFEAHGIDTVVHFAAETHVDRSIHDPGAFLRTNVQGTFVLLEAARQAWRGKTDVHFHHISTDEVYGSLHEGDLPCTEETPYRPSSPYSATKAASDHLVRAWGQTYGIPTTVTLSANTYGPHQFPEKLIPLMILHAAAGEPLPVYGTGENVREWLHVEDHCAAVLAVIARGRPGEAYNVSAENPQTNLGIVRRICALLDERVPAGAPHDRLLRFVADRPGHDLRYALDASKIRRETGWQPRWSLEDGLGATVDWYLKNERWVAAIQEMPAYRAWMQRNYRERGIGPSQEGRK